MSSAEWKRSSPRARTIRAASFSENPLTCRMPSRTATSAFALEGVDHFILLFGPNDDRNRGFEQRYALSSRAERSLRIELQRLGNVNH